MTIPTVAVVIMGVSGVGKDTLAREIVELSTPSLNFEIFKFATPIKRAIAAYLDIPVNLLEDREFRTTPLEELDGATPLDILVKSFDVMPQLHPKLGLVWAKKRLDFLRYKEIIPVFTDTRNLVEVEAILKRRYDLTYTILVDSQVRGKKLSSDIYLEYNRHTLVSGSSRVKNYNFRNNGLEPDSLVLQAKYLVKTIEVDVINYGN